MSIISGEAVERMRKLTDAEVIKIALNNLKDIFPEEVIIILTLIKHAFSYN